MISVRFQGKPFNITVIHVYAPTSNAEGTEVERFYEDLQDLLELTPKKDVLFITGDCNAKERSQETPGVTGKFGLGMQNEAGQRLIIFCQENALVIANTLFQQHKRRLYTWTSPRAQGTPKLKEPHIPPRGKSLVVPSSCAGCRVFLRYKCILHIVPRTKEALNKRWVLLLPTLVGETQRKKTKKQEA